jgi:hypothetical protein
MWNLPKSVSRLAAPLAVSVALGLAAAAPAAAQSASDRLTADEVRRIFIDREWTQGTGFFLFSKDGNFRYFDARTNVSGTYQMADDGTICAVTAGTGVRTCYTFHRDGNGYRYWHDRSGRFWPATPR